MRRSSNAADAKRRASRIGAVVAAALAAPWPVAAAAEAPPRPSVLIHCARASPSNASWCVDLDYLAELHARGFEVDYTDEHADLSWDRVRRYDVLVLYAVPLEHGAYYDNTPDRPPYRDEFVGTVERFLQSGGGVLLMARAINGDESFLPLIRRWGARIPYERIVETDPARLAPLPRMGDRETLWWTRAVAPSPVSEGVEQVWLPLTPHYAAAETMPIEVGDEWTVVLRGSPTSHTEPIDPGSTELLPPADRAARREPRAPPDLFAIRERGPGRIAFCAIWPQFSLGQGTQWLYERRVLERGVGRRPSHFGRLLSNTLRWLAAAGPDGAVGGYRTDPLRLVPPNERPERRRELLRRAERGGFDKRRALERALEGRLFRGLIGARTAAGGGSGSVADYAAAARRGGLDFVVFVEDFSALDPAAWERHVAECARHSGDDLQLYPGYAIETSAGSRMFLYGRGTRLPPPEVLDGDLVDQYAAPAAGGRPAPLVHWINYQSVGGGQVNVGYYGFADRPHAPRIADLRLYSAVGLRWYDAGRLVEDRLEDYLAAAAGTLPPVPVAVHVVRSPAELERAARGRTGLTWARADSLSALWEALGYAHQLAAPNVFTSDGPLIEAWPAVFQVLTLGAERFVAAAAWMPSPLVVTSEIGLDEVRIYDGDRLFRRFLCGGRPRLEVVLELAASVQRTLVVVAEDVAGGRAVSVARRSWKGGENAVVFCADRINDCDRRGLLAKGPGVFQVSRVPQVIGGYTWDGGPRGERPILDLAGAQRPALVSDRGAEGPRGLVNRPRLELADEEAVRVGATFDRRFDERLPFDDPWHAFGPIAGPTRWMRSIQHFTAFGRPSLGAPADGSPGHARRGGAAVSLWENRVSFLEDQRLRSLGLFGGRGYGGPYPIRLLHGRGGRVLAGYDLTPGRRRLRALRIGRGEWFAALGPAATNLSVHVNRGAPLELLFSGGRGLGLQVRAAETGPVLAGDAADYELLSVVDPLDAERRGVRRARRIVGWLRGAGGIEVARGRRVDPGAAWGIVELEAEDGAAQVRVRRPARPAGVPLPLRLGGLNPRWTAGVFQLRGHVLGSYGDGSERFHESGIDRQGRIWVGVFADEAETTELLLGHPVTCDRPELFIQVTRRHEGRDASAWHVSLNNPTDAEVEVTLRAPLGLPGIDVDGRTLRLPPGGYVELQ